MSDTGVHRDSPASTVFVRRSSGLVREISAGDALAGNVLLVNLVAAAAVIATLPFTFPGANMPLAVLLALVPSFALATVYVLFNIAMPRSGGDYVYISRTLHPSVGFAANFSFVAWNIIFGGFLGNWISTIYLNGFFGSIGWTGAAASVSHKWPSFLIGGGSIILMALIVLAGTRIAMRIMNLFFYVGMAGLGATIILVAFTSHSSFKHAIDKQSSYNGVITAAHQAGFHSPSSWNQFTPTLNSVALISLTTLFVMFSAYAGGEVRNVRRSVPYAIYGSAIIGGIVFLAMALVAVHSWGNDFIASSNFLSANAPDNYHLASAPSFNFFAVAAHESTFWAVVVNGSFVLLIYGNLIFGFITLSRCLFAWSFDRILPQSIARVNARTHTPVNAIMVLTMANLVALIWYTFEGNVTFLGGATMGFISTFLTTALAAVVFPYVRRNLYRASPAKIEVLGVPLITIAGVASIIMLGAMVYAFLSNDTFGANSTRGLEFFGGLWVVGFVLFYIARTVRRREGIDIDTAFAELPPD